MENLRQHVRVSRRHGVEEAARDEFDPFAERRLVPDRLRQVEDDSAQLRPALKQSAQQLTVAAADVDDNLVGVPVERGKPIRVFGFPARHRRIESAPFGGMLCEPAPEVSLEPARQSGDCVVEHRSEEVRKLRPTVAAQEVRRLGVAEDARRGFREDTVARERAQDPVERLRIRPGALRELGDGPGPGRKRLGDLQVGGEPERLRRHRTAEQVPQLCLRSDLAHVRAAATAAAASSTSSSVSVRQSSRSRPSRRIPTTGGSPARSGTARDSSTAQA